MNPGTTIFIVIGIIGLMLYALKALKAPLEAFTGSPLDDANSLLNVFGTPDIMNRPKVPAAGNMVSIETSSAAPIPSLSVSAAVPQVTAIPAPLDPTPNAPIIPQISVTNNAPSQTISDRQGAVLKRTEAFEAKEAIEEALDGRAPRRKRPVRRIIKKQKCPPMPDMSLYIRKDQIPCWGCVLK